MFLFVRLLKIFKLTEIFGTASALTTVCNYKTCINPVRSEINLFRRSYHG